MVCVYALIDPRDQRIRYIGASVNPNARYVSHLNEKIDTAKTRWLRELKDVNLRPELREIEWVPDEQWEEAETWWIAECKLEGCDLTNATSGGVGLNNPNQESRNKLSENQRARMSDETYRAKVFTEERNQKLSESLTGKSKSPEHVAKLPQNQKGFRHSEEVTEQLRKRFALYRRVPPIGTPMHPNAKTALMKANIGNQYTKGRVQSRDEKLARSLSEKGVPKTHEHRNRISEGQKRLWQTRKENGFIRSEPSKIVWPSLDWIKTRLLEVTQKELAIELGVKPGTLGAYLWRKTNQKPKGLPSE